MANGAEGLSQEADREVWEDCAVGQSQGRPDAGMDEFNVFSLPVREFIAAVYDDGAEGKIVIPGMEGFSPSTFA